MLPSCGKADWGDSTYEQNRRGRALSDFLHPYRNVRFSAHAFTFTHQDIKKTKQSEALFQKDELARHSESTLLKEDTKDLCAEYTLSPDDINIPLDGKQQEFTGLDGSCKVGGLMWICEEMTLLL